jgi:hypothetical protein
MTPEEQRRLLNERDDLPPSVSAEFASLTAIQTFLLETGERRAAAKLADEWLRRFKTFSPEPTPVPAQPEVPLEVAQPQGVITRRTTPDGIIEVIIETPEPGAIAEAVRAFLRLRLAQR